MPSDQPDLSIVIPALNERENLELLLPALRETIAELDLIAEMIVIDGGSTDDTARVAEKLGATVIGQNEQGYGGALLAGFAAARAAYVVTMDADLSHQPVFLKDFWDQKNDAELLIASRYVPGGRAEMGFVRRTLSLILNAAYGWLLALPFRDLSSGFRMYDQRALAGMRFQARDFDALEEILVRVYIAGSRIKEVPFHYQPRKSGRSHAKLIRFGWAFSKTLLRMWRLRNSGRSEE